MELAKIAFAICETKSTQKILQFSEAIYERG